MATSAQQWDALADKADALWNAGGDYYDYGLDLFDLMTTCAANVADLGVELDTDAWYTAALEQVLGEADSRGWEWV